MEEHRARVEARIREWVDGLPATSLYEPMAYLMGLPAKRVRPVAVLMGCELFGGRAEQVLDEALGIEVFHNFTLMHDDIMDAAPLRRGRPTVHAKWGENTAILSGDAMLVKAFQLMGRDAVVSGLFTRHALEVCEGQQSDMDFERRDDVGLPEYMEMIRKKTAVLLSCALRIGAAVAGAPEAEGERLGRVGEHLGLAFQLRDDLLDAFGDPGKMGKRPGGDLRAGKKTWLLIRGLEHSGRHGRMELREELAALPEHRNVERMMTVLRDLGVPAETEAEVARHDAEAMRELDAIAVPEDRKTPLRSLVSMLRDRVS